MTSVQVDSKHSEHTKQMEEWVLLAQGGCEESTQKIFDFFGNNGHEKYSFFNKYRRLITDSTILFEDYDTRRFLSLFISDKKDRVKILKNYQSTASRNIAANRVTFIQNIYKNYPKGEIDSDMNLILLDRIHRYKRTNRSFMTYVMTTFNLTLKDMILSKAKSLEDRAMLREAYGYIAEDLVEDTYEFMEEEDARELDLDWISGKRCSAAFTALTNLDRMLLVEFYINKKTDTEIAESMGVHRNTALARRHAAIVKIKRDLI